MDVKKAIQRLEWRFEQTAKRIDLKMVLKQGDIDALVCVSKYIKIAQNESYIQNEHFAKLYIMVYAKMIEHYKVDMYSNIPRKSLIKMLEKPIDEVIKDFTTRVNELARWRLLENITQKPLKHPALMSELEKKERDEKILKHLQKEENLKEYLNPDFDIKTVKEILKNEFNLALEICKQN